MNNFQGGSYYLVPAPSSRLVVLALLPRLEYLELTLTKAIRKRKVGRSDSIHSIGIERFQFPPLRMNVETETEIPA